jgi:hypothetical protein
MSVRIGRGVEPMSVRIGRGVEPMSVRIGPVGGVR